MALERVFRFNGQVHIGELMRAALYPGTVGVDTYASLGAKALVEDSADMLPMAFF
jgi:hypothetical protein